MLRGAIKALSHWPVVRQVTGAGMGAEAVSARTLALQSRLHGSTTTPSVCPYCAVGCGTLVRVKDGEVVDVEGNPASPINQGTLCPKGAGIFQYTVNPDRITRAMYRRPYGRDWEPVELDWAMDRIASLMRDTRDRSFIDRDTDGNEVHHTEGIGFLGGAALDNEENYLIKKLCVGAGVVFVENQARI